MAKDRKRDRPLSEAKPSLIRRAACLTVELVRLEQSFANGEAGVAALAEYGRARQHAAAMPRKPRG
jgi:hypothetical protein